MGILDKFKSDKSAATPAPAASTTGHLVTKKDLGKVAGAMVLRKGELATVKPTGLIRVTAQWNSATDYDLLALVLFTDGHVETVSQFGTSTAEHTFTAQVGNGAVRHLGDIKSGSNGRAEEIIEIRFTPEIAMVVPVAYSAQGNGTGSFKKYGVSLAIDNGEGTKVTIDANDANANNLIYSVAIGSIRNNGAKGVQIEGLEMYSKPTSENRPLLSSDGSIKMDAGPRNAFKR